MSQDLREEISVRARFERFPATVKGAFVIRGEDANPHQVMFRRARIVLAGAGTGDIDGSSASPDEDSNGQPITMKEALVHAPPHQDVFLPFEFPITELGPGWYGLEADLEVDGAPRSFPGGRIFVVAWPRAAVRRGTIAIGETLDVEGGISVRLQGFDCGADHAWMKFSTAPAERVAFAFWSGGTSVGVLETEFDAETGEGRVKTFPLLREFSSVRIDVVPQSRSEELGSVAGVDLERPVVESASATVKLP